MRLWRKLVPQEAAEQGKQLKALGIAYWMWPKERDEAAELLKAGLRGEAGGWLLAHRPGLEPGGELDETEAADVAAMTEGETEGNVEADPDGETWPEAGILARSIGESGGLVVGRPAAWRELFDLRIPP